jgi:hypothetical protein
MAFGTLRGVVNGFGAHAAVLVTSSHSVAKLTTGGGTAAEFVAVNDIIERFNLILK